MPDTHKDLSKISIDVENVGGIDRTHVDFEPGVTVLAGRNATNRTSLLKSIMAALGSDVAALKGDTDKGSVELTVDGTTYTRTLSRRNGHVTTSGDPYLDDPKVANLFAFLLEDNRARRAVERGDDLREIIMQPVNTDDIQRRIEDLQQEKKRVSDELDELDSLAEEQTRLIEQRERTEDRIEETRAALEAKREEVEAADADVEESGQKKEELEAKLGELQETRSELENVRHQLETERDSLESLRTERTELTATLEDLPETPAGEVSEIDRRLERLRGRKETIERTISDLQSIIAFNEDTLEGNQSAVLDSLSEAESSGALTDQLVAEEQEITCWTCGSTVQTSQIDATLDRLNTLRQENLDELNDLDSEIEEHQAERREYQQTQERREKLERDLERIEEEIDEREARIESLQTESDELEADVESLEETVESLHDEDYSAILDLQKEANQLEFELDQAESKLSDVQTRLADIESRLEGREELTARREEIRSELEDVRTRVRRIEQEAIEAFNTHMETVLDVLEYENLERIWLERKQKEVREGRRKVTKSHFELHVVRTTESGATYEDTVDHLSESEREVTGLLFALAGYLVHDVYEDVPFILLDSLEAIDSNRIAALVDYFEDLVDNLVVALLPEDADALSDRYQYVETI